MMIIGTNKETKNREYRVALLPSGVEALVGQGHTVLLERGAGSGAGLRDGAYEEAGATLVDDPGQIYAEAELIYKVKEPMSWEYDLLRPGQTLFTYIHSAGNRPLCDKLLEHRVCGIAFEDVELDDGRLPLLEPMSAIAGYMGMFKGLELLQTINGGSGLLPGGLAGVRPTRVMILGGGYVGCGALQLAHGVGAEVTVLDIDVDRLEQLGRRYPGTRTLFSNAANIRAALGEADLLLNAVMWPKTREGHLVTREMLGLMPAGAVVVDVAADIHGGLETCERQTTHDDPTYVVDGHVHYVVANIPSLAARSASEALSNVTLPYALRLADQGTRRALLGSAPLRRGLTCIDGQMVRAVTAEWYGCDHLTEAQVIAALERA
jgi:alanine dehydrogenase